VIVPLQGPSKPRLLLNGEAWRGKSITLLDIFNDSLLCTRSGPATPPEVCLVIDFLSQKGEPTVLSPAARRFDDKIEVCGPIDLTLDDDDHPRLLSDFTKAEERSGRFQALALLPKGAKEGSPLLCFPHGGPHAAHSMAFSTGVTALVLSGFAVVLVNYRGSIGLGQESLLSLPGHVGDNDVRECVAATRWALSLSSTGDERRVGVLGGSHGGFLGAHLTGQYPNIFSAAVLRNPVVNIASMSGGTDIADWCFCESGLGSKVRYTDESIATMFRKSPLAHAEKVRAPTLLQIGDSDRRVPPQQGMEWLRALRRNGVEVRVMWYKGAEHGLVDAVSGDDSWAQAIAWLTVHLKG